MFTRLHTSKVDFYLDAASKLAIMQFLQFLCVVTQDDLKKTPLVTMLPMIIIFTSMLGQVEEIISGLVVNAKSLMPYFCVYIAGTECTDTVVLNFHHSTYGIIN